MSKPLKPRRGTTAEHNTIVGEAYEITYDTDKNTLVAHDGMSVGGFPLAKEEDVSSASEVLRAFIAEEVAKYLPLVGGVMAGGIQFEPAAQGGINVIRAASQLAGYLQFCGGPAYASGASMALYGINHTTNPGAFLLNAQGSEKNSLFLGSPDGTLMWAGKNVVRSVNDLEAGSDGEVRLWAVSKSGVNLNNITEAGTYYVSGDNLKIPSGSNGYLFVTGTSSTGALRQIFYRIGTVGTNEHNYYTRARGSDGTWGEWAKFLTDKDTITASSATSATKAACLANITSAVKTSATSATTSKQGSCTVSTTAYTNDGTKYYTMAVTLPSGGSWHWVTYGSPASAIKTGRSSGGQTVTVGDAGLFLAMRYA